MSKKAKTATQTAAPTEDKPPSPEPESGPRPQTLGPETAADVGEMRKAAAAPKKKRATRKRTTTTKTARTRRAAKAETPAATPPVTSPDLFAGFWRVVGMLLAARGASELSDAEVRHLAEATVPIADHYLGPDGPVWGGLALTSAVVLGPRVAQVAMVRAAAREAEQKNEGGEGRRAA